jgi:hypothetical protein
MNRDFETPHERLGAPRGMLEPRLLPGDTFQTLRLQLVLGDD